jgi:SAM-dependent methyltransferase
MTFDREAVEYATARAADAGYLRQVAVVVSLLGQHTHAAILDVGCGTGDLLRRAAAPDGIGVGVDLSTAMLRVGTSDRRGGPVHFVQGQGSQLPIADGSFDAVISLGLVEYLWPDVRWIAEIHRVLRPNGVAVLCFPHGGCAVRVAGDALESVYAGTRRVLSGREPAPSLVHRPRRREFDTAMAAGGFVKEQSTYCFPKVLGWPLAHRVPGMDVRLGMALEPMLGRVPFIGRMYAGRWRRA